MWGFLAVLGIIETNSIRSNQEAGKEKERERKLDCLKCLKPRFRHESFKKKMQDYSNEMDSQFACS